MWMNESLNLCNQALGTAKYQKLINKNKEANQSCFQNLLGQNSLSYASHKAIKHVTKNRHKMSLMLRRYNAVGAVGYAHVIRGNPLNHLDFFGDERCYKLRFRLSNVMSRDDASSSVREAAIKFCDQDHDGPFDLIMYTGRFSLVRDCNSYVKLLKIEDQDELKKMCLSDPFFYRALVDGLRRSPSSYADLTYYGHLCYRAAMPDNQKKLVKFRLIPMDKKEEYKSIDPADIKKNLQVRESGHLEVVEQQAPWNSKRRDEDKNALNYLKAELKNRLGSGRPVSYYLEVQIGPLIRKSDYDDRNPQLLWDETTYPWSRVMEVELTTALNSFSIRNTRYNLTDKPKGLIFSPPEKPQDPFSLQKVLMSVYTEMEMKGTTQVCDPLKKNYDDSKKILYKIIVVSESLNVNRPIPYVEIYVTLLGIKSRSIPLSLNNTNQYNKTWDKARKSRQEEYFVECDSVDNMLGVFVEVYYRHITEHWFLRKVIIEESSKKWVFPCFEVVEAPVLVFPGDVCLGSQVTSEASKKERIFQLKEKRVEYKWEERGSSTKPPPTLRKKEKTVEEKVQTRDMMPGCIRNSRKVDSLPFRHRSRWIKYTGLRWEVDPRLVDFFRAIRFNRALKKTKRTLKNKIKTKKFSTKKKGAKSKRLRPEQMRFDVLDGGRRKSAKSGEEKEWTSDDEEEEEEERSKRTKNMVSRQSSYAGKNFSKQSSRELKSLTRLLSYQEAHLSEGDESPDELETLLQQSLEKPKRPYSKSNYESGHDDIDGRLPAFEHRNKDAYNRFKRTFESLIPDGTPGDMCRLVEDDFKFGLSFLVGTNPRMIKKCTEIPRKFGVTESLLKSFLKKSLAEELQDGTLYIADYELLDGISTVHQEADHRFITAPIVLFRCDKDDGLLVPIAIQLNQNTGPLNSVITPNSSPIVWLHAKLWVRCSDFNYQFAVSHIFTSHLLMEPFLIATMRCLPQSHPVYKILLPHFRNLLLSNTMMRQHLLCEKGPIDTYTSLGRKGFLQLMQKYYCNFSFKLLNPIRELESRQVLDGLPFYYYRDDSIRIFNCLLNYCRKLLKIHYKVPEIDFERDFELTDWLNELKNNGFPGNQFDFFDVSTNESEARSPRPSAPSKSDLDSPDPKSSNTASSSSTRAPNFSHLPPSYNQSLDEPDYPNIKTIIDISKTSPVYDEINITPVEENFLKKQDKYNKIDIKTEIFEKGNYEEKSQSKLADILNVNGSKQEYTIEKLAELLASVIFTITCLQSATRSDALDIFGFIPEIPAMMKCRPVDQPISLDASFFSKLLPDQVADAYFSSLLFILNHYHADRNLLTDIDETYFVDEASLVELKNLCKELKKLSFDQQSRNKKSEIPYDNLIPFFISASPEPLPFIHPNALSKITRHLGPSFSLTAFLEQRQPASTWHYVLDLCLSFHEVLGSRSIKGWYSLCKDFDHDNYKISSRIKRTNETDIENSRTKRISESQALTRQSFDETDLDHVNESMASRRRRLFSHKEKFISNDIN